MYNTSYHSVFIHIHIAFFFFFFYFWANLTLINRNNESEFFNTNGRTFHFLKFILL